MDGQIYLINSSFICIYLIKLKTWSESTGGDFDISLKLTALNSSNEKDYNMLRCIQRLVL